MSHHDLHSSGTRSAAHSGNLVARRTPAPAPGDRRYPQASMSHHDLHSPGTRPGADPGSPVANPNRQGPPRRPRPRVIAGTRRPRCHTPTGTAAAPARRLIQVARWPPPAAWSSRRPSARRPRCSTPTGTAPAPARGLIPVARWPGEHRPRPQAIAGTRWPRCHTTTCTAPAPDRRLIPVTWWPGEHRPRPQASAGTRRPRCSTTTATSPTGRLQRQAPGTGRDCHPNDLVQQRGYACKML